MKKLLKISALALAMSAVLFSCANPNNTPSAQQPEAPKPTDVVKPEGFTPTEGATTVTAANNDIVTALQSNASLCFGYYVIGKISADEKNAKNFADFNTKNIENSNAIREAKTSGKDKTVSNSLSFASGKYDLAKDGSFININEYTQSTTVSYKQSEKKEENKTNSKWNFVLDLKDARTFMNSPKSSIISLKQTVASDITQTETEVEGKRTSSFDGTGKAAYSMIFDIPELKKNGILTIAGDQGVKGVNFTSVIFYDLDGKESYKYTDEDLKTLNKLSENM